MFQGFSKSVMGASHQEKNTPCQDSSAFLIGDRYAVAVVADGHGSKKHFRSHVGSQAAVDAVKEVMERFYADPDAFEAAFPANHKSILKNIEKQVIAAWNVKITEHLKENPVTTKERGKFYPDEFNQIAPESYYGTTLIAAVMGKGFTFGFQIGDGSLVAVFEDGETAMLMDYEESNPANITSSMCNSNAAAMFGDFYVEHKKPFALFVSTDGLYTSFGRDSDFLDYHTIIASQLADAEKFEAAVVKNMQKRSHFGTQDDISLACVYDQALAESNINVIKAQVQKNKQLAEERKAKLLNR